MKQVHGLHQEDLRVVKVEVGLHHRYPGSDHKSPGVVKLVMRLHHGSPTVVKLEVGLDQGSYIREHEVSRGGEARDGALSPKMQEGEVHDGTSP